MAVVEKNTLHCSFCGKSQHEVKKLITGPSVFICDECTIQCLDVLVDDGFQSVEGLSCEQQILRREQRVNELIKLVEAIVVTEEARSRPYVLLKKKLHEFDLLRGPPKKKELV